MLDFCRNRWIHIKRDEDDFGQMIVTIKLTANLA